jgi:hypothetical protein
MCHMYRMSHNIVRIFHRCIDTSCHVSVPKYAHSFYLVCHFLYLSVVTEVHQLERSIVSLLLLASIRVPKMNEIMVLYYSFWFKLTISIRRSHTFHVPTIQVGWSTMFAQFPLPPSQSSISANGLNNLGRYPKTTVFFTTAHSVEFRLYLPRLSVHGGTVQ